MKSNKEYKAKERQRKKELGLVRWECWCTTEQREAMKNYLSTGPIKIESFNIAIDDTKED